LSASPFSLAADGVRVALRVTPGAGRTGFAGLAETADGVPALKVTVTAIAEDGRANDAVLTFLAKSWRLPKSSLTLVAGHTGRNKILHVRGAPEFVLARLLSFLAKDHPS
jgi:uncharacterized protein